MYQLIIKFNIPGLHNWPDAPKQYEYLRNKHRHQFYFEVRFPVEHAKRQLEIIQTQADLINMTKSYFGYNEDKGLCNFAHMSCEQISRQVAGLFEDYTGIKCASVQVLEDNENGAMYIQ